MCTSSSSISFQLDWVGGVLPSSKLLAACDRVDNDMKTFFFKSSSHYSHRITDHLTAQGSWALRVHEICLRSNCFGIIDQNPPFPSRKAMRLLWHMCTITVKQFNTLKGHQYEGKQNFGRKCAKSDTKPCWNVNSLRWTITQGNQMTFFGKFEKFRKRKRRENQYPKDVHTQ